MIGARSTCVSVRRVIRICVGMPTARGDRAKRNASCFAPPDDTDGARWLDHLRARATSVDADSMPELGHGLCKPWHWPWSGRRPWTEWPSAFGRRALFSLSSAFERPGVTTSPERPNDKGYLKCEACDHWLPRLWDKKNSLCARCSGNRELRAWFDRELA